MQRKDCTVVTFGKIIIRILLNYFSRKCSEVSSSRKVEVRECKIDSKNEIHCKRCFATFVISDLLGVTYVYELFFFQKFLNNNVTV